MNAKAYIESGILETYVLGIATETEADELMRARQKYPEVNQALQALEMDMELVAENMAILPPPGVWDRIEQEIDGIIPLPDMHVVEPGNGKGHQYYSPPQNGQQFIEVEGSSSHMRIHKAWRWVFAAVFVMGKIFLGFAIYFYLENRQAQEQIKELKSQVKVQQSVP